MCPTSVKTDMLKHSQAKVELYSTYLATFLSIMRHVSHIELIYLFDLFAGEGQYEDGSFGSPITACNVIKDHYFSNNKSCPNMMVWFNDRDMSEIEPEVAKIDRVRRFAEKIYKPDNVQIKYFQKDYDDLWPAALEEVDCGEQSKALFFIDPYGYKDIDPDDLKQIMRAGDTEVLIFLPASHMYRFTAKAAEGAFPGGAPLRGLLCKVFRDEIPHFSSVHDFIRQLSEQFCTYFGQSYNADTFTIERDQSNVYCLMFFTGNELGFQKMLEAKWKLDHSEGTGHRIEKTLLLFGSMRLNDYPTELLEYVSSAQHRTNHELYIFGLKSGFLPKHTNSALKDLLKSKMVEKFSLDGASARGNYIKYRSDRVVGFKVS